MKELRLKHIDKNPTSDLSAFINTIYDHYFHEISNLEDTLERTTEPLHYLILKIRLDTTRNSLKMFETVVDNSTEYVDVEEK